MNATAQTRPGFWLNLPDGWLPLDPRGGRIPQQVRRLLDRRAGEDPQVAAHRGQVEQQLRAALRMARAKEFAFGAILATFTAEGLPITASLALTRHRSPDGAEAGAILAELGEQKDKHSSLFEVPFLGTVARSEFLDRTPVELPSAGRPGAAATVAEVAVFQYFLPVPGRCELLLATGATPTLPLREVFGTLFDAIVSTFQFLDEPAAGNARQR